LNCDPEAIYEVRFCPDQVKCDRDDLINCLRAKIREVVGDLRAIERGPVGVHVRIQYPWPSGTAEKKKATDGMADGKPPSR
jgi:hypothetical protein